MIPRIPGCVRWALSSLASRQAVFATLVSALVAGTLLGQPVLRAPRSVISDWARYHVLYPERTRASTVARIPANPRVINDFYLRHQEDWWREIPRGRGKKNKAGDRDWSMPLSAAIPTTGFFEPLFNFAFSLGTDIGYGTLNSTDNEDGEFLAIGGNLNVTGGQDVGAYLLSPGGPGRTLSPSEFFYYDNLLYPSVNPLIDINGLLFFSDDLEVNIYSNAPSDYELDDNTGYTGTPGAAFTLTPAPGGGQTYPAKFVFDVTAAPSCTNDFVVIGIPANLALSGQANIVGMNNLYSTQGASSSPPYCDTTGPNVIFAYASGSGQVPGFVTTSLNGTQIAYIENLITGSSYFHVLTIGTTGNNGSSATAAVVPGNGNNAVDQTVLLSPDGGITNQSSTNAPFIVYSSNDANDFAYATTYSTANGGSGYLYKLVNIFNGSAPTIAWSLPIDAIPSTPIFDDVTDQIFFTDSNGRIDYVFDNGTPPAAVVYGPVFANGTTSENPITLDYTNQVVYACFNSNGTNAIVVQAPATNLQNSVSVPLGPATTVYGAPYGVAFNNAWYTGSGTPLLYVAGTAVGTIPTLFGIGFNADGTLNPGDVSSAALASAVADSSPVTEFYNSALGVDYLFVAVTNNCIATLSGGTAGCVISLDITSGFPTVNAGSTALSAPGGTTGIIVDNDSTETQASSIYFGTKTGVTLVKATQSGLN